MIVRRLDTRRKYNIEVALSYKSHRIYIKIKSHFTLSKSVLLTAILMQTTFWKKGKQQ